MATQTETLVIDADAHVVESARTWDFLDPDEERYRPALYGSPERPEQEFWFIDGKTRGTKLPTLAEKQLEEMSRRSGYNVVTAAAAREMDDVELRLNHMDELGVDAQVLHNTLWITNVAERPDTEAVLCRCWNRWMADVYRRGRGRLRWSCVLPTLTISESLVQMRDAKENGAVAVCLRAHEANRHLIDPYFYPLYEEAQRLDLAIVVHVSNADALLADRLKSQYDLGSSFSHLRVPTVTSCHEYIMSEVPSLFPALRWGFIEVSAQWAPWLIKEARRRSRKLGRNVPWDIFPEYRIYAACETDDDLEFILKYAGEDNIVIGTDYGHTDISSETDAIGVFRASDYGISEEAKRKILTDNPRRLYAL